MKSRHFSTKFKHAQPSSRYSPALLSPVSHGLCLAVVLACTWPLFSQEMRDWCRGRAREREEELRKRTVDRLYCALFLPPPSPSCAGESDLAWHAHAALKEQEFRILTSSPSSSEVVFSRSSLLVCSCVLAAQLLQPRQSGSLSRPTALLLLVLLPLSGRSLTLDTSSNNAAPVLAGRATRFADLPAQRPASRFEQPPAAAGAEGE